MSKLLTTGNFLEFPVNNKYNKNIKNNKNYDIKQSNMKEIYLALVHARDMIDRPVALRYTIGLDNNHTFDINKLTRKIKSLFKSNYSFIYSFEYAEQQKGLHLEMILVVDQTIHNPLTVFNLLRKVLFNLDGVTINIEKDYKKVSFNFHERKEEYLLDVGGSKVGHSLKDEAQFKDCMFRASYLAKQNDKALVQYKKTFGTTTG
jgi:hypothetical protein